MIDRLKSNPPENDEEIARRIIQVLSWTEDNRKKGHVVKRYWTFLESYSYLDDIRVTGDYTEAVAKLKEFFSDSGGAKRRPDSPDIPLKHATADQERLLREARNLRIVGQLDVRPDVKAFRDRFQRLQWLQPGERWDSVSIEHALHSPLLATQPFDILDTLITRIPDGQDPRGRLSAWQLQLSLADSATGKRWCLTHFVLIGDAVEPTDPVREEVDSGDWNVADILALERVRPGTIDRVQGRAPTIAGGTHGWPLEIWGLRGSVLGDALQIAQPIADEYPLTVEAALVYLLTGELEWQPIVQAHFLTMPLDRGEDDYPAEAVGPMVLVVDPFVSPDGVQAYWSDLQEFLYGDERSMRLGSSKRFRWRAPSLKVLEATLPDLQDRPLGKRSGRRKPNQKVSPVEAIRRRERIEAAAMPTPYILQPKDLHELEAYERFLKVDDQPDVALARSRAQYAQERADSAPPAARGRWEAIVRHWQRIADSLS